MKALLKIIWFAFAIVLLNKFGKNLISTGNVGTISDKLNSFLPFKLNLSLNSIFKDGFLNQLIFIVMLFLGLDIISGDIKGIIKGPIKLALNTVLYVIGFSVVFFLLSQFNNHFNITF